MVLNIRDYKICTTMNLGIESIGKELVKRSDFIKTNTALLRILYNFDQHNFDQLNQDGQMAIIMVLLIGLAEALPNVFAEASVASMARYRRMKKQQELFADEEIDDELYSDADVLAAKDKQRAEVLEERAAGAKAVEEGNAEMVRLVESFERTFDNLTFMQKAFRMRIQRDMHTPLTYKAVEEWYDGMLSKKMIVLVEKKMVALLRESVEEYRCTQE
jgi:hypothetical protein